MTAPQQIHQTRKWQLTQWWQRQNQKERSSRRNLLMRLIIGGTTLAVSISAYYSYQVVRNLILDNLKRNALLEVQQGVHKIDGWLDNRSAEVQTLASTEVVRSLDWSIVEPYLQAEVKRSQTWGEKEQNGIGIIYQCGSHLLTLINDFLDISKIEACKLELQPKALHFPSFLQAVIEISGIRAEQKGIDFC